jgi:muramidase (phage lysozyme)
MAIEVEAFLHVIRHCEGTAGPDGYRTLFGGKLFDSFDKHPKIYTKFKLRGGKELISSAAGAYQFLYGTWTTLAKRHGYKDFGPENQDLGAIELIKEKGALNDVMAGRIEIALKKCNTVWASLPGSPYGQPVKSLAECLKVYHTKLEELKNV